MTLTQNNLELFLIQFSHSMAANPEANPLPAPIKINKNKAKPTDLVSAEPNYTPKDPEIRERIHQFRT